VLADRVGDRRKAQLVGPSFSFPPLKFDISRDLQFGLGLTAVKLKFVFKTAAAGNVPHGFMGANILRSRQRRVPDEDSVRRTSCARRPVSPTSSQLAHVAGRAVGLDGFDPRPASDVYIWLVPMTWWCDLCSCWVVPHTHSWNGCAQGGGNASVRASGSQTVVQKPSS
jgi:hypothetical protein